MKISLLESPDWKDYELLDSGDGLKLERFGPYRFIGLKCRQSGSAGCPNQPGGVHGVFNQRVKRAVVIGIYEKKSMRSGLWVSRAQILGYDHTGAAPGGVPR